MRRRRQFAPGEVTCPICGNRVVVRVAAWEPSREEGEQPPELFGLAVITEDGRRRCCCYAESSFTTAIAGANAGPGRHRHRPGPAVAPGTGEAGPLGQSIRLVCEAGPGQPCQRV